MWYSLEHGRRLKSRDVKELYKNISFPAAFTKGFIEITPEIAEATRLIPLLTPAEPESGVDYDPDFQQPVLDFTQVTVNESQTEAFGTWVISDVFQDILDEEGNVLKTKEQIKAEVEEEQAKELAELERIAEEEEREQLSISNRSRRDSLLLLSDQYVTEDWGVGEEEEIQEWLSYRQALRDLPSNSNWPTVDFPVPPIPLEE